MAITCATNKDTQICDRKKDYGTLSSDLTTDVEFLRFVPSLSLVKLRTKREEACNAAHKTINHPLLAASSAYSARCVNRTRLLSAVLNAS